MAPEYKKYIHQVDLETKIRDDLVFSDYTKIRMYDEYQRIGIRLRPTYNKYSSKMEFPLDDDLSCTLQLWEPQEVKGWLVFQEISFKPTGTSISWRLNNGTSDYWYSGGWVLATADSHWNTEQEVNVNISTFPYTQKKIRPVAKLKTTDKDYTPILYSYRIMMQAQFDWWEDLILRSVVPRLREDMTYIKDFSGILATTTNIFNVKTDDPFIPEEDLNVIGIDAVYDHDNDPSHDTDLFSSFNASTGDVTMTSSLPVDTRIYARYIIEPEIILNFQSSDYTEVGKIPALVIDGVNINSVESIASLEIVDKTSGSEIGHQTKSPLYCKTIDLFCTLLSMGTVDNLRMLTQVQSFVIRGATQRPDDRSGTVLKSNALGIYYNMKIRNPGRYSPKTNLSDVKTTIFDITIEDVYLWLKDVEEIPVVVTFNRTIDDRSEVGPIEEFGVVPELPAGVIKQVYIETDVENQ